MNEIILLFKADPSSLFDLPGQVKGHTRAGRFIAPYTAIRRHALKKPHHALSGDLFVHDQGQPATHVKTEAVKVSETIKKPATRVATGTNDSGGQGSGGNGGNRGGGNWNDGNGDQEARRQYAAVVARYTLPDGTKAPGWLKAPNGKPTNLNERQWVQARTPLFKEWFGDWETMANRNALDAMPAIQLDDAELARLKGKALRDEVSRRYNQMKDQPVVTVDGKTVRFTGIGLREVRQHGADRAVLDLLAKAHDVLSHAIPLWSLPHKSHARGDSLRAWHYYGAKVSLEGKDFFARLVLREDVNGHIYYDNDVSSVEEVSGRLGTTYAILTETGAASVSADDHSLGVWYRSVNPDVASKVIDANGEPLVMYHATQFGGFSVFHPHSHFGTQRAASDLLEKKGEVRNELITRLGRTFLERMENGETIEIGPTDSIYPVFLSIKNPKQVKDAGDATDWWKTASAIEEKGHYDGLAYENVIEDAGQTSYLTFSPTQIKSALGNTGEFSPANADILKAFPPHAHILFFKAA